MPAIGPEGSFVWYDLMTSSPKDAIEFYTKLIGWGTQEWEGDMPYTMWTNGGVPLGGVMELPEDAQSAGVPPNWLAYVKVNNVAATAARVEELGGTVHHPATEIPGAGSFSVLADPQGAVFAVYSSTEEAPAKGEPAVGEFSWHELAAGELESAFAFYSELFAWERMEAMDAGEIGAYQLYGRDGRHYGGMFTKPEAMPAPPMWVYYISVPSVKDAVARVEELGGQVVSGPMEVPGGDLIAQCLDPEGAFFALHSKA